jgi:hypothetical protein
MLVKESISFERGKDPKEILGIGQITPPRTFTSSEEFADFLIKKALPYIFDGDIPKDILSKSKGEIIPWDYYNKIIDFLLQTDKTFKDGRKKKSNEWRHGGPGIKSWPEELKGKLLAMGYKNRS